MSALVTITSITGAQQSAIAEHFAAEGWTVRGTSRRAAATSYGPAVVADLESSDGLGSVFRGSDVVVLTLPQDHRTGAMPRIAASVAQAAAEAGIGRLVLNSAGTIAEDGVEPLFVDMRAARDAVRASTSPWVIIQPTVFMDNLLAPWSVSGIANDGLLAYPVPEAAPVSWMSHRSLAASVYAAATHPEAVGRELRIGGPDALTGTELSEVLSERVGRSVRYQRIPLDGFAAGLDQAFGAPAGQRIASLYARLDTEPTAMRRDLAEMAFLGATLESFSGFAARHDWSV